MLPLSAFNAPELFHDVARLLLVYASFAAAGAHPGLARRLCRRAAELMEEAKAQALNARLH